MSRSMCRNDKNQKQYARLYYIETIVIQPENPKLAWEFQSCSLPSPRYCGPEARFLLEPHERLGCLAPERTRVHKPGPQEVCHLSCQLGPNTSSPTVAVNRSQWTRGTRCSLGATVGPSSASEYPQAFAASSMVISRQPKGLATSITPHPHPHPVPYE